MQALRTPEQSANAAHSTTQLQPIGGPHVHTDEVSSDCAGGDAAAEGSKPPQVHEGFSEALGLPLKTADGELLFKPTRTRYYQTLGTENPKTFP